MERIIVEWYKHEDNTTGKTEVNAFNIQEAIDIIRQSNDFKVVCLGVEYKNKQSVIDMICKLNGSPNVAEINVTKVTE